MVQGLRGPEVGVQGLLGLRVGLGALGLRNQGSRVTLEVRGQGSGSIYGWGC